MLPKRIFAAACCLLSLYMLPYANAVVAGVDFGGEFFKIALVKPGTPFEIVTNVHSKRKTETLVAFDGDERLYGADAATVSVRRPQTAYSQLRRLIGTVPQDPVVTSLVEKEYYPYKLVQNLTRGTVSLQHGKNQVFQSEELVAMVFTHARQITNTFAEAPVKDWVITVPDYFTQAQRQALLDAAEISGVRVLSLINENTAAALQLAVHSTFKEPRRVLFFNMGSTSLQVSVVEFTSQVIPDGFKKNKTVSAFQVLSKAWDPTLGGAKFDLRLAEHFAKEFGEKVGEDVTKNPRVMAKLLAQAKKTKVVLSANDQIPVALQSLYNDVDFFTTMTRSKLEGMCADLYERTLLPVKQALERADLTIADIDDIEIIGGGVRMPKIQQQLKEFFSNKDLGVHLNGDEAMALGAAFHGANLSNSFRVRHVGMTDVATYAVGVRLVDMEPESADSEKQWVKRASLFTEVSRLGLRKAVSFLHAKDISATFRYDKPSTLPPAASSHIAKFNISGIAAFAEKTAELKLGEPKVTLSFELDNSGIVRIAKAEATLEEEYEVEVEVKPPKKKETKAKSKAKTAAKDNKAKDDKTAAKEDKQGSTDGSQPGETPEVGDEEAAKTEEPEPPVQKIKEKRKRTHRAALTVTYAIEKWDSESGVSVLPMTEEEKKDSIRMLRAMESADNERRANLEAKNHLESFVYSTRDTLSAKEDVVAKVTTPELLEKLHALLEETEEWLYDEGEKVTAAEYNKKIYAIEKDFNGIVFRMAELKNFPSAISKMHEYAATTRELVTSWIEAKPQITEEERKDVLDKVDELEAWLDEAVEKQKAAPAHETPVVTSADVTKKAQGVKKLVATLLKKPKPKPKPVAEANATTNGTETEGATVGDADDSETEVKSEPDAKKEDESTEAPKDKAKDTIHEDL